MKKHKHIRSRLFPRVVGRHRPLLPPAIDMKKNIKVIFITENIEPTHKTITIKEGGVLNISFPHAMPNLEMCFLTQPATTFDRYYDRDMTKPSNYCGYTLPNINQDDQGLWDVVAVGQIVYKTSVYVSVSQPSFWNKLDMLCRLMPWCRFGVITGRLPL